MLTEPLSLTDGTDTYSLARTGTGPNSASYRDAEGVVTVEISHAYKRRNRHTIRLNFTKTVPDELIPSVNTAKSMSIYLVVDTPAVGFTMSEINDVMALWGCIPAGDSGAAFGKIISGQS